MSLVSIIIPAYNCASHLSTSIESALNQTWQQKEIIVVNDGSTDNTSAILSKFQERGVVIINQPNCGASTARNTGLRAARGEWIQFLDADDFLREDKIAIQLSKLKGSEEIAVCRTVHFLEDPQHILPDPESFFTTYLDDPLRFLIRLYGGFDYLAGMIQPNAYLVSRRLIELSGGWNEELSLDDDGEFFCRVVLQASRIVYSPEPMNYYRKYNTAGSLSGSRSEKAYRSQFKSICLKHRHLLNRNRDKCLVPYIHTATYKAAQDLLHLVYPHHPMLYTEIKAFSQTLIKHSSRGEKVYGGPVANFIGNRISWKLLKRLQILKAKIKTQHS
jgi:glycosyltransferase involved in cell wall biosynthesis